jgi:uncharacterized Zn finger protein
MDEDFVLTLDNFESVIDPEILKRGRDYYKSGSVTDLEEDAGSWTATVVGTYDYTVEVEADDHGFLMLTCDCPYEYGPYCKHEAAVLFAIRAEQKRAKPKVQTKQEQRQSIQRVVESLTHEQLVQIVMAQVKKDKTLGNQILLQYGAQAPDKSLYQRTIQDFVRKHADHGYLDYQPTRQAAREIDTLLAQAEAMIGENKPERALPVLQAVIESLPEVLSHADDSAGELGGCMEAAFDLLEKMAKEASADLRQTLFDYCLNQHNQPQYRGWDFGMDFLWQASELVDTPQQREALFAILDKIASSAKERDFLSEHRSEHALRLKTDVMKRMGDPPEAIHALLLENVHLNLPRQQLVALYMEQKQYAAARKLCEEAINKYAGQYPGLVVQYQNLLLEIARQTNDTESSIQVARDLLLQGHEFDQYYTILKSLIKPDAWPAFRQQLILTIQKQSMVWLQGRWLGEIYRRDQMWPELLKLAQRSGLDVIEHYRKELHAHFPDEMCDLYEEIAVREMQRAGSRDQYRAVCSLLRRMMELEQPERAEELIERFKALYPRRRAMIEELNQI